MSFIMAFILGAVQGLTEFLPVSSSGHLCLLEHLAGIEGDMPVFHSFLHAGSLFAIIALFRKDIMRLMRETVRILKDIVSNLKTYLHASDSDEGVHYIKVVRTNYRKLAVMIVVDTLITVPIGILLVPALKIVTGSLLYTGICFFISAVLILVAGMIHTKPKIPKDVSFSGVLSMGLVQGMSVLPGISQSGGIISMGLLAGLSKKTAVRYAYLAAVPVLTGSFIFELISGIRHSLLKGSFLYQCLIGMVMSAVVGYFSISGLLKLVIKHKLRGFAIYSALIGIVSICLYFANF